MFSVSRRLFSLGAHSKSDLRKICERFATEKLKPVASQLDREQKFPVEQIAELGRLGLMGITAPVEYGGLNMNVSAVSQAVESLAVGCSSCAAIVSIHNILYVDFLKRHANAEQKKKFLAPYTGGTPGAFALSEADAGSDVANLSTSAVRSGEHFILNGSKTWVTSGNEADVAIVFATLDKTKHSRGISAFLIPLDSVGVERSQPDEKLGIRATSTCQIHLCDVCVPVENVVGEIGGGFKLAIQQLNRARIGIASQAIGIAQAALDTALEYAIARRAFGKHLIDLQAVQIRLARMAAKIEAARLLVRKAAKMCDNDENIIKISAMAKLMASEAATFTSHQCIQILGGMGYVNCMPAERYYRDARVTEIYGGVSDIQMLTIAEQLLKEFENKN